MTATLEKELYHKLNTIPEITGALLVIRRLDAGDELWLFVVLQGQQLEPSLEARIIIVLERAIGLSALRCRVFQLSFLPVTRSGRLMRRQVERFVNHLAVPNRLQMRNPEVLEEIALIVKTHETTTLVTSDF